MIAAATALGLLLLISPATADWAFFYVAHWNSSGT
jgi:hypothetical protein